MFLFIGLTDNAALLYDTTVSEKLVQICYACYVLKEFS